MTKNHFNSDTLIHDRSEFTRREFTKILGSGLLISIAGGMSFAGASRSADQNDSPLISERLHIGTDGVITVMTGKVEVGQGSRTEITQVAAEELDVRIEDIRLVMGDTDLVPDDGSTGSSLTTPRTVPRVRAGCAAAKKVLVDLAAEKWNIDRSSLKVNNGTIIDTRTDRKITFRELAQMESLDESFNRGIADDITVTLVKEWNIMGRPAPRINGSDIVTGAHRFPSDIVRPGMQYGKVLNPPAYNASLISIDTVQAKEWKHVTLVREDDFVGVTAPTSHAAEEALKDIAKSAKWKTQPQQSSKGLFEYFKKQVSGDDSKIRTIEETGSVSEGLAGSDKVLQASYEISHIQHATLEPRAAVAEWNEGKLTVWTGTADPFPARKQLAELFGISLDHVRVIVPDVGGHFCGKHAWEAAVQAARLAKAAKRPVSVRWTREEDFTWAYFRWAGLIEIKAGLDNSGNLTAWDFMNYNSGTSAFSPPYDIPNVLLRFVRCESPLREGSYRAVAAPANLFARESFIDELSLSANADPLKFRLAHIQDDRLRTVLQAAAERFDWKNRSAKKSNNRGIGLACGTEKGAYVAACVEVEVERAIGAVKVLEVCQAFECGAIINPLNLRKQVEGAIVMGLGGALWEEIKFENGRLLNASFGEYRVPRFKDTPEIETILIDRPDIPSTGAGETPMIVIAPAVANAVHDASGIRIRSMPMRGEGLKQG